MIRKRLLSQSSEILNFPDVEKGSFFELSVRENNRAARYINGRMDYIEAFFEHWEQKILFLQELFDSGHQDEAATLCYVYLDGFGYSLYWPMKRSAFTFVRVLCEHGQNPFFRSSIRRV